MLTHFIAAIFFLPNAFSEEFVKHPVPTEPVYVKSSLYDDVKKSIPLPPALESDGQKADVKELLDFQNTRTDAQCKIAKDEIFATFQNFFGTILNEKEIKTLEPMFGQLRNDGDFFVQKLKKEFARKRPYFYNDAIHPCITKESTGAYPSGHATLSKLYALVLGDIFPDRKEALVNRALEVGKNRILAGVHHPSDIRAGQALADFIYSKLKSSQKFKEDLSKFQKSVLGANGTRTASKI
jgi:acid phosphatase (class A)